MKRAVLAISVALVLLMSVMNQANATNKDANAKMASYYAEEEQDPGNNGASSTVLPVIVGGLLGAGCAYLIYRRRTKL